MAEGAGREKENVIIRRGECSVSLRPPCGGKIASLRLGPVEFLQTPLRPYAPRTRAMGFDQSDASGWDECLPSVAGCTVETPAGQAEIPDHGDLWRVEWKTLAQTPDSITLQADAVSLPLTLVRKLTLVEMDKGYRIHAEYTVTNTGEWAVPWSWSAHPGYAAEEGDKLLLPASIRALRVEWSRNNRLGKGGDTAAWPVAKLSAGGETDLRIASPAHSGVGDKLFAGPLAPAENWVALERPKAGVRLTVRFDPAKTPYLGLWICQGGYPEGEGLKQHCVAMEPCTAPVDSLAVTGPWSLELAPGRSYSWPMTLDLETIEGVNRYA